MSEELDGFDFRNDPEVMLPGVQVVFTGASDIQVTYGNYDDPRPLLVVGEIYVIVEQEVQAWCTKLRLGGVFGWFNSVCFDKVKESPKRQQQRRRGGRIPLREAWFEATQYLFLEDFPYIISGIYVAMFAAHDDACCACSSGHKKNCVARQRLVDMTKEDSNG